MSMWQGILETIFPSTVHVRGTWTPTQGFHKLHHDSSNMKVPIDPKFLLHLYIGNLNGQLPGPIHSATVCYVIRHNIYTQYTKLPSLVLFAGFLKQCKNLFYPSTSNRKSFLTSMVHCKNRKISQTDSLQRKWQVY